MQDRCFSYRGQTGGKIEVEDVDFAGPELFDEFHLATNINNRPADGGVSGKQGHFSWLLPEKQSSVSREAP